MIGRRAAWRAALFAAAVVSGCGGGGGGGGGSSPPGPPLAPNEVAIVVDSGPAGASNRQVNVAYVSLTICAPGTSNCQTLDHVAVDTGSSGLRVAAGALAAQVASALVQQRDAQGGAIVECVRFADGHASWGPVKVADLKIGEREAPALPIQLMGDSAYPIDPGVCAGTPKQTVADWGAKGILGLGYFRQDCGEFCASDATNGSYFGCPASGCTGVAVPRAQQVAHPVPLFAEDNNGVLVRLPAIAASGATSVRGSLIFGIGTRDNNALGAAKVYGVDPQLGIFTLLDGGSTFVNSGADSGSNVFFVPAALVSDVCPSTDPVAPGFLCPAAAQDLQLTIEGGNGATGTLAFSIGNAHALLGNAAVTALDDLGAPSPIPDGVFLGLPFFYGRSVFTAIEGASTPQGAGPYVAF